MPNEPKICEIYPFVLDKNKYREPSKKGYIPENVLIPKHGDPTAK